MTYAGYLSNNPLFWSAVAGAAIGGAVASITRRAARSLRPAQARSRKLTTALLFLTIGVAAAALGMLTPPRFSIITYQSLYVFLGALLFFGIALRFPRAAGVPALLVVTLVFIASVAVIREWFPVRDDASLAVAHVLSADEDRFVVEIDDRTPGHVTPNIVDVPGRHIEPVVDVLEVSNYLFFFGTNRGIRLAALSSAIDEPPAPLGL